MNRFAVLQMSDTPEIESTAILLRAAGYDTIKVCGPALRAALLSAGLDTVLSVSSMLALGYDALDPSIGEAAPADLDTCDLFVEIKVRNLPKLWDRWPRLRHRTLWKRVNGAQPEICPAGGDEVNFPCPLLTACLWYGTPRYQRFGDGAPSPQGQAVGEHEAGRPVTPQDLLAASARATLGDYGGMAYTFWPPYPRSAEYDRIDRSRLRTHDPPYCVAHSGRAWGYGQIIDACVERGVHVYGNNSPHGQVSHRQVPAIAATALALVHLKSVDCPGWALYEAILAGCPAVTGRLLNSRMLAYDLLKHGETCCEFGVPASLEYGRGDMNFPQCLEDIDLALAKLRDPGENRRIGEAGRRRLNELLWREERDGDGFRAFMRRWFP